MQDEDESIAHLAGELKEDSSASILHHAVADGQFERVAQLANSAEVLAEVDSIGRTPLHWAACLGYYEIARLLVRLGAPLDMRDANGKIACDLALTNDVEVYLQAAADAHLHSLKIDLPRYALLEERMVAMLTSHQQLESICRSLEHSTPLVAVNRFPGAARAQAQAEKAMTEFLNATAIAQVAYLAEMRLRTTRLEKQRGWHEKTMLTVKKMETLASQIAATDERVTEEVLKQYQATVEIYAGRLKDAEQRIEALDAELERSQEQLKDMMGEKERLEHLLLRAQRAAAAAAVAPALPVSQPHTAPVSVSAEPSTSVVVAAAAAPSPPDASPPITENLSKSDIEALNPRDLIAWLRRRRGFDLDIPPHMSGCLSSLHTTLTSAIQKLASDIYSSSSRFVVELIQNADDNSYESQVLPSFHLELNLRPTGGYVLSSNNEVGFRNANVVALCDIGGSTKTDAEVHIGRKGVGFKSVFKVSDRPFIFSRNFAFNFDSQAPLGHIVPQPASNLSDGDLASLVPTWQFAEDGSGWKDTRIFLPLRADHQLDKEIMADVGGVDHILLFLRRLRRLGVTLISLNDDGVETSFAKEIELVSPREDLLTTLSIRNMATGEHSRLNFKVHRKRLTVPPFLLQDESRPMVAELALAFPVLPPGSTYPGQFVFCYLPVKQAGLRFIVQADFELVTSRQDIHHGKPVNLWLRDQIAPFFVECLHADEHVRSLMHVFLPSPDDVSDNFWRAMVEQLWNLIATEACIPTVSGKLAAPKDVLLTAPGYENLISNEELLVAVGREWVAESFDRNLAMRKLHVRELGVGDVVAWLKAVPLASKPSESLATVYELLQTRLDDLDEHAVELAKTACLRLADGSLVALHDRKAAIFQSLPPDADALRAWAAPHLMDPETVNSRTTTFLARLGIAVPDDRTLAKFVVQILPQSAPSRKAFWLLLEYVRRHVSLLDTGSEEPAEALGSLLLVPDQRGQLCRPIDLYLPHVRPVFDGVCEVRVADAGFMALLPSDGDGLDEWITFLAKLGIGRYPRLLLQPDESVVPSAELDRLLDAAAEDFDAYCRLISVVDEWFHVFFDTPRIRERLESLKPFAEDGTRYSRKRLYSRRHFEALCGEYIHYAAVPIEREPLLDLLGIAWKQTPQEMCECLMQVAEHKCPNPTTWHALYAQLHRALLRGDLEGIQFALPYLWMNAAVPGTEDDMLVPRDLARWSGDAAIARHAGLVLASAVDPAFEALFTTVFLVSKTLTLADHTTAMRKLKALPLLAPERLAELQADRAADTLDAENETLTTLAHVYRSINTVLETDDSASLTELVGLPLLLEGAQEGARVWLLAQVADLSRPVFLDNPAVWTAFGEVLQKEMLFPTGIIDRFISQWAPTLLLSLDAIPASAFMSSWMVWKTAPAINHAKSIMYRRAISLVLGLHVKQEEGTTEAQIDVQERFKGLANHLLVYDVRDLMVRRSLRVRKQQIAEADTPELFFLQEAKKKRPPMLFVDAERNGRLAINFDILNFITGIPMDLLLHTLSTPTMIKMLSSDLTVERVGTSEDVEKWNEQCNSHYERVMAVRSAENYEGYHVRGKHEGTGHDVQRGPMRGRGAGRFQGERRFDSPRRGRGAILHDEASDGQFSRAPRIEGDIEGEYSDDDDLFGDPFSSRARALPDLGKIRDMSQTDRSRLLYEQHRSMFSESSNRRPFPGPGREGQSFESGEKRNREFHGRKFLEMELPPTALDRPRLPSNFRESDAFMSGDRPRFLDMTPESLHREFAAGTPNTRPSELQGEMSAMRGLKPILGRFEMETSNKGSSMDEMITTNMLDSHLGAIAEIFFLEYMRQHAANFTEHNWVSRTREHHYPELGEGNNRLGYDFEYVDSEGSIGPRGDRYMFEVKGQASQWKRMLIISDNEWRVANQHSDKAGVHYVIVVVTLQPEPARILHWLDDPEQLRKEGLIELRVDNYNLHVRTRAIFEQSIQQ